MSELRPPLPEPNPWLAATPQDLTRDEEFARLGHMRCFKCSRELESVWVDYTHNQPYAGLSFTSNGHYGGTLYDPMDGSYIEIFICDVCLDENKYEIYHSTEGTLGRCIEKNLN